MSLYSFLLLQGSVLQLFESAAQLIRARGALGTAADAVDLRNHIVDLLSTHQLADSLEVAITTSKEEHLLYHVILIGSHVNQF